MRLIALAGALLLATGCTALPKPPVTIRLLPPVELLQDCPVSPYRTKSNADLGNAILVLKSDIARCNNDKAALREWADPKE